jgi:predicted transcriptional regulator
MVYVAFSIMQQKQMQPLEKVAFSFLTLALKPRTTPNNIRNLLFLEKIKAMPVIKQNKHVIPIEM